MSRSDYQGSHFFGNWSGSQYPVPPAASPAMTGLVAWFKSDAGVTTSGGNVTAWVDQIAGVSVAPYSGHSVPFVLSSVNGLPGLTFNANSGLFTASTAILTGTHARYVFSVCKTGSSLGTAILSFGGGPWFVAASDAGGNVYFDAGSRVQATPFVASTSTPYCLEHGWDGNSSHLISFAENGTSKTVSQVAGSGTSGTNVSTFTIGNTTNGTASLGIGWIGDCLEHLIYDRVPSVSDITQTRAYLSRRYGF